MLEKQTLRKILDFCDGPYDFMLIENIPCEHRSCMNLWHFYGWRFLRGGALCHVALPGWRFPGLPMWRFLPRKRHIGNTLLPKLPTDATYAAAAAHYDTGTSADAACSALVGDRAWIERQASMADFDD